MRTYGTIGDVDFTSQGWSIYNLAYGYRLRKDSADKIVYVTNMRELKEAIANFIDQEGKNGEEIQGR